MLGHFKKFIILYRYCQPDEQVPDTRVVSRNKKNDSTYRTATPCLDFIF